VDRTALTGVDDLGVTDDAAIGKRLGEQTEDHGHIHGDDSGRRPSHERHTAARASRGLACLDMKGDKVEVLVDVGGGAVQRFEIVATKAGRRVDISNARGTIEVTEVTRSGQAVRSGRFMATRVVAIIEHPASG
jgi:hypothetical protein